MKIAIFNEEKNVISAMRETTSREKEIIRKN